MKRIILSSVLLGSLVCRPPDLPGQESLLTKTIKNYPKIVYSVAFSPDGKYLAAGGSGNVLNIWRLEDGARVKALSGHAGFVNSVAFSRDGRKLVSAGEDGSVRVWSVKTGAALAVLRGHKDFVSSAAFFPDGKRVASAGADGVLRLWRLDSQTPYKAIPAHAGYIYSVAVSSDGVNVASAGVDKVIRIWDAESGSRKAILEGHSDAVNSIVFAPKGHYLASGSDDGSAKIWRLKDPVCVKTFSEGKRPVLAVAYSPDGAYVFSGGGDNAVRAWGTGGNPRAVEYLGHGGLVRTVAISPDGKYMASGSFDKTIKLWLTPWEAEARNDEMQTAEAKELEKDSRYAWHYQRGSSAMASPNIENLELAQQEFSKALSYRERAECRDALSRASGLLERKRGEELAARRLREQLFKDRAVMGAKGFAALVALLAGFGSVRRLRRRSGFRKGFSGEVKVAAVLGDYVPLFERYMRFREIGGDPGTLPPDDLLRLYHGVGLIDKLPRENIPYSFLLAYAVKFSGSGNHRTAIQMLRSGELLDEFRKPEDYSAFVELYEKVERPETLLMRKFKPATYSSLAEAFLRAQDYAGCKKVCELKKQFYPGGISRRDKELAGLAQEKAAPGSPQSPA